MENEQERISPLLQEFYNLHPADDRTVVAFYEKNKILIDRIDIQKSNDNYKAKIRILGDYGIGLTNCNNYRKGVKILRQAIHLYENAPRQDYEQSKDEAYFETMLWNYGDALHQINQTQKALKIFKRLHDSYPENDSYRNWKEGLKEIRLSKIIQSLWHLTVSWIFGEFAYFKKLNPEVHFKLSFIGVFLFVSVSLLQLYIFLLRKGKIAK